MTERLRPLRVAELSALMAPQEAAGTQAWILCPITVK